MQNVLFFRPTTNCLYVKVSFGTDGSATPSPENANILAYILAYILALDTDSDTEIVG